MEDIYQALNDVGYDSMTEVDLKNAVELGPKSIEFTGLVAWISKELQILYSLEEHVNKTTTPEDSSSFLMELSSFLRELGCQYLQLIEGHMNERLDSESKKLLLLDYLITELKAAKMIQSNKPDTSLKVTLNESTTAVDLKNMLQVLKFPKPPANIPPKILFDKVEAKLKEVISKVSLPLYGEPLFTGKLSDKQWHVLEDFYKALLTEYSTRKELLLKRLDVTIQSFEWSERLKSKSTEIYAAFRQIRENLSTVSYVRLSDILAARKDLAIIEKTSSASVRRKTRSDVNKVMIGMVPDRGGRPYEQEPPPPEMPSWQQRSSNSAGGGRGRGRGNNFNNFSGGRGSGQTSHNAGSFDQNKGRENFSRGGRVQAGWNQSAPSHHQNAYESGGGYSKPNGGHQNYNSGSQYQYQGNMQNQHDDRYSNREFNSRGRGGQGRYSQDTRNQDYSNRYDQSRNYYDRR